MSYLLDRKNKRNKYLKRILIVILFFIILYFWSSISKSSSSFLHYVTRPFFVSGQNIKDRFSYIGVYLKSKKDLYSDNENLRLKLLESEARVSNYNSLSDENLKIKEILNRKPEKQDLILAGILAKPDRSPYDTIVVDVGISSGVFVGKRVFAFGNIPIGTISEVFPTSSKVSMFSTSGEKTEGIISGLDTYVELVGRGGGNFEMILPRDFILSREAEIVLPGIYPYTLAKVVSIISDPRDSFQKVLLISPVNIFGLKFVEVEK